jgi:hypothetical protein
MHEIRLKRIVTVLYVLVIVATVIAWALKRHPYLRPY